MMRRGERIARGYVGAVLVAQALVAGATSDALDGPMVAVLVMAGALLWAPLVFDAGDRAWVRTLATVPAVGLAVWWAAHSASLGTVAWSAWALATAVLCLPAPWGSADTLAEWAAARWPRTGENP